jgi:hypothetical protein
MCRRMILIGAVMAAVGAGLILSCLFNSIAFRVLFGAALVFVGFIIMNRRY